VQSIVIETNWRLPNTPGFIIYNGKTIVMVALAMSELGMI